MADRIDSAGRAIAGLLGYNPGPGIYSRLERAVQAMPANVRAEELPGLLKRYKDGVPGWELKEADFPGLVGDAQVIPRQDLLDRVRERSPVYTHKEIVLGGRPQSIFEPEYYIGETPSLSGTTIRALQRVPSPLGQGVSHGSSKYQDYGQGGEDYSELLLLQPNALGENFGTHWSGTGARGSRAAVAHARYDTHGDALRINELQSDLGIHNRKAREAQEKLSSQIAIPENYAEAGTELPFPLEDAWSDLLIKRLALEAARGGHRAIEVASPAAVFAKTGNKADEAESLARMEHFYGKVVPGAIERLGRKMGGLTLDPVSAGVEPISRPGYDAPRIGFRATDALNDAIAHADGLVGRLPGQRTIGGPFEEMTDAMRLGEAYQPHAEAVYEQLVRSAVENGWPVDAARTLVGRSMPQLMRRAEDVVALNNQRAAVAAIARDYEPPRFAEPPGRRYLMSDEMRKRILTQGIGASVLAPMLMEDE